MSTKKELSSGQMALLVQVIRYAEVKISTTQWEEIARNIGAASGHSASVRWSILMKTLRESYGTTDGDNAGPSKAAPKTPTKKTAGKNNRPKEDGNKTPGSGKRARKAEEDDDDDGGVAPDTGSAQKKTKVEEEDDWNDRAQQLSVNMEMRSTQHAYLDRAAEEEM